MTFPIPEKFPFVRLAAIVLNDHTGSLREKNGLPRLWNNPTSKLLDMLNALPRNSIYIFGNPTSNTIKSTFTKARRRIANRLQNPRLLQIHFHTLRHWKATMEYAKTKDILHVMQILGHKNIKNTLLYVQLAEELFKDRQEYTSKVAKTEKDACELVEAGFEYVCDFDNAKIFRKKKY